MADAVGVLVWLDTAGEPDVVAALGAAPGVRVERRCADLVELLGAASAGLGRVAVISLARGVDRARVAEIARLGLAVVLVAGADDLHRAGALGAAVVVPDGAGVAASVARAVAEVLSDPPPVLAEPEAPGRARRRGTLVAVWSAPGAPGRTTFSAMLAAELQSAGAGTAVVDADTRAPSLGQVVGLLEESAGLAALCRSAAAGTLDAETLRRRAQVLPTGVAVVTGVTRAERWREIGPDALAVVIEALREHHETVIVDLPAGLEAPPPRGADRDAVSRLLLQEAEEIVVVLTPDPVSVRRTVQSLGELDPAIAARRRLLVNQTRPVTTAALAGARDALQRFAGLGVTWSIPYDAAVPDAVLAGRSLAEHAPRSPARRATASIALEMLGERPGDSRQVATRAGRGRLRDWLDAPLSRRDPA